MVTHTFHAACPILRINNLEKSLQYYVDKLGFKVDWVDKNIFASVSREDCHLMLSEGDQGNSGSWVWIGVADVEKLYDEYKLQGALIRHPPTNFFWAYEMQVTDLDNNVLRMGSEPQEGKTEGPWLDMNGTLWYKQPDGSWKDK